MRNQTRHARLIGLLVVVVFAALPFFLLVACDKQSPNENHNVFNGDWSLEKKLAYFNANFTKIGEESVLLPRQYSPQSLFAGAKSFNIDRNIIDTNFYFKPYGAQGCQIIGPRSYEYVEQGPRFNTLDLDYQYQPLSSKHVLIFLVKGGVPAEACLEFISLMNGRLADLQGLCALFPGVLSNYDDEYISIASEDLNYDELLMPIHGIPRPEPISGGFSFFGAGESQEFSFYYCESPIRGDFHLDLSLRDDCPKRVIFFVRD